MSLVLILGLGFLAILVIVLRSISRGSEAPEPAGEASFRKTTFMTPAEKKFFIALEKAVNGKYRIFAKPHLMDIIHVETKDRAHWQAFFNRISRKHVDFLLCHPETMDQACVIELDDSSHTRADRQERDRFLNDALKDAGIPIARIPVLTGYSPDKLMTQLEKVMAGPEPAASPEGSPEPHPAISHKAPVPTDTPALAKEQNDRKYMPPVMRKELEAKEKEFVDTNPVCPHCTKAMVLRVSHKGPNPGSKFWGCVNYPACRHTVPYTEPA